MNEVLKDDTFLLTCMALYANGQCTTEEEFYEDLSRIKYLKKLVTRYEETGELKERLIINHLVILNNVFGPEHLARLLYLKMSKQFATVKPFLEFLSIMPKYIDNVLRRGRVMSKDIPADPIVVEKLRNV
jgi:hypothetical protein